MKILITSDDGYDSEGVGILVEALEEDHEVRITATATQQSGVGAKINFHHGGEFEEVEHLGLPTLKVEGSPVDAVEISKSYWSDFEPDVIVSGLNYGPNIGSVISSGTVSAAFMGLIMKAAPRAMALSFRLNPHDWLKKDKPLIKEMNENIVVRVKQLFELCSEHEFFDQKLLNINIPREDTNEIRFTKLYTDIYDFYNLVETEKIKGDKYKFIYPKKFKEDLKGDDEFDVVALHDNYISITPLVVDLTDSLKFSTMNNQFSGVKLPEIEEEE
jgi:5'-nucleotidase